MARTATVLMAVLVLLPALRAEDKAAGEFKALAAEYKKAHDQPDFQKQRSEFIRRFLDFAQKHPRTKEAVDALFIVLHADTQAEDRDVHLAMQLILKDHVQSDHLTNPPILQMLAMQDSPAAEKLLHAVIQKNPHHTVQAQAYLSLAQLLKARADASPPGKAARLNHEAEQYFARVVDRYADVKEPAETAKSELFEIRHLSVGKTAPEIKGKDSDAREFKLSDYRGKVVVLDFWAEW